MANRKVFISFLGTGNYVESLYSINGKITNPVRFVQEALIKNLCDTWTADDRILIFCTEKAKQLNWNDNGHDRVQEEIEKIGLQSRLMSLDLNVPFDAVDIKEGFSEKEIWSIFNVVYDHLKEGDELYFDVTHAFRSIPMFSTILFNYAQLLKGTKLKAVHYGAFESLGPAFELRKKPLNERGIAPILDLMPIAKLQDWTMAANSFLKYGKMQHIGKVIYETAPNQEIQKSKAKIKDFEDGIATCRGNEIKEALVPNELAKRLTMLLESNSPEPVKEISHVLLSKLVEFGKDATANLKAAIDWCLSYGLTQQAYTLAQESILTILCDRFKDLKNNITFYSTSKTEQEREFRKFFSSLLGMNKDVVGKPLLYEGTVKHNYRIANKFFSLDWLNELRKPYNSIVKNRNDINHAGFVGTTISKALINNAAKHINECWEIVTQRELTLPEIEKKGENVFINFSNHPSKYWEDAQIKAAKELGATIEDIDFPQINPDMDNEHLDELAQQYLERFIERSEDADITVHVMGEMVFTYKIVTKLMALGILCVASTTERKVSYQDDGTKTTSFSFVKFRDY